MFGRRFAQRFDRGDWEGWTPPWMQQEGDGPGGPHFIGGYPRHGFFGPRGPFGQRGRWSSPEFQALWSEAAEVARLFTIATQSAFDKRERLAQLHAILERTRKELTDLIYGTGQTGSTSSTSDTGQL